MAEQNLSDLAKRLRPLLMPAMNMISTTTVEAATVSILSGTGLSGGGLLDQDRTLAIDLAGNLTWTGAQTFQGQTTTRDLLPEATDSYDLGSSLKLWRKGWLSELDAVVFAKNTVTLIGGWLVISKGEGTMPADVLDTDTQIDFGQAMTVGEFVLIRAAGKVEYLSVGSLVSGTTYNVTRDLDGSGENDWPAGTPYAILGQTGDGRIELNAYTTPRISILRQGATYGTVTEPVRIGDLEGWDDVGTTRYGIGLGDYAGGNYLRYEPVSGFIVQCGSGAVTLDADGVGIKWAATSSYDRALRFIEASTANVGGSLGGQTDPASGSYNPVNTLVMAVPNLASREAHISILADGAQDAKIFLSTVEHTGSKQAYLWLYSDNVLGLNDVRLGGDAIKLRSTDKLWFSGDFGGWYGPPVGETWSYASATTFTVPGDQTARFQKGTKIRLVQTYLKFFTVVADPVYSSPNTTVTVTGGSDYSLSNAAIVDPFYSYEENPQGFPQFFNYTPTWSSTGTQPAIGDGSLAGRFSIHGKTVRVQMRMGIGSTTTFGTGAYTWSVPVAIASGARRGLGTAVCYDLSVTTVYGNVLHMYSGLAGITIFSQMAANAAFFQMTATGPFTWANGDTLDCDISYEF